MNDNTQAFATEEEYYLTTRTPSDSEARAWTDKRTEEHLDSLDAPQSAKDLMRPFRQEIYYRDYILGLMDFSAADESDIEAEMRDLMDAMETILSLSTNISVTAWYREQQED